MRNEIGRPHARSHNSRTDSPDGGKARERRRRSGDRNCLVRVLSHDDLQMDEIGGGTWTRPEGAAVDAWYRTSAQPYGGARTAGVSLGQRPRSSPVRP